MTPEDGDEAGKKVAEEVAKAEVTEASEAGAAGSGEAPAAGEAPAEAAAVDLSETVIELEEELAKTKDRLLRTAADYENYRKRAQREHEEARVRAREEVLRELIGVYDNLERAVESARAHGEQTGVAAALIDGAAMVQRQFLDGLGKFGLKQFSAVGTPFDPAFHEAMAQQKSDAYPPGTVTQEYLKGYMLGDRLLRAAMVIVASPDSTGAAPGDGSGAAAGGDGAEGGEQEEPSDEVEDRGGSEEGSA